jgi:hypothetical protein
MPDLLPYWDDKRFLDTAKSYLLEAAAVLAAGEFPAASNGSCFFSLKY